MNHDQFVGHVQHRAHLPSRGAAEKVIRATFETLGERLQKSAAEHIGAQLPPELARHLQSVGQFEHLSVNDFYQRVAQREPCDLPEAVFHVKCVMETIAEAVSPGAFRKLQLQLPVEFQDMFAGLPATVPAGFPGSR